MNDRPPRDSTNVPPPGMPDDRATQVPVPLPDDDRLTQFHADDGAVSPTARSAPDDPAVAEPPAPAGRGHVWSVGDVVAGGFELVERLRGGAQAAAFRGKDRRGEPVFVKITANDGRDDAVFAKQIELRPQLLRIRHPNLMQCLAMEIDHGDLVEVCEFIAGETLESLLHKSALDDSLVRELVAGLAEALQTLHQPAVGLIHRDLKPSNVMLVRESGRAVFRLVDYGVVTKIESGRVTHIAGTPKYSPPERIGRSMESNELARAWDWWMLGSIAMEAAAGVHPYEQLVAKFGTLGTTPEVARRHLFDQIQKEVEFDKYRIHAGMVEMVQHVAGVVPWLPLLRGLLTYNPTRRWGHAQVAAFLAGEKVPEYYAERRTRADDVAFEDEQGNEWRTLAEFATRLAGEAAATPGDPDSRAWAGARRDVAKGAFLRHASQVMHDADLVGKIAGCIWLDPARRDGPVRDIDLATAAALFAIAEGAIATPNVHGIALGADYARFIAVRAAEPGQAALEAALRALLVQDFGALILSLAAPASRDGADRAARELREIREAIRELRSRAAALGVRYPQDHLEQNPSLMVRLVLSSEDDDARAIADFRSRIGATRNVPLQKLQETRNVAAMPVSDRRVLRLALTFFSDNDFESFQGTAERYRDEARQMSLAEAFQRGGRRLRAVHFAPAALMACILATGLAWLGFAWQVSDAWLDFHAAFASVLALPFQARAVLALAPIAAGLLAAGLYTRLRPAAIVDLDRLDVVKLSTQAIPEHAAAEVSRQLALRVDAAKRGSLRGRLRRLNARLKALPGVDRRKYFVGRQPLPRSSAVLAAIVVVLAVPLGFERFLHIARPELPKADLLGWAKLGPPPPNPVPPATAPATFRFAAVLADPVVLHGRNGRTCRVPAGTVVHTLTAVQQPGLQQILVGSAFCARDMAHQVMARVGPPSQAHGATPANAPASAGSRAPATVPGQIEGAVDSIDPYGLPVIHGERLQLSSVLVEAGLAREVLPRYLATHGNWLSCAPVHPGAVFYRCFTRDGKDVAEFLAANGLAIAPPDSLPLYKDAQKKARDAGVGRWAAASAPQP